MIAMAVPNDLKAVKKLFEFKLQDDGKMRVHQLTRKKIISAKTIVSHWVMSVCDLVDIE